MCRLVPKKSLEPTTVSDLGGSTQLLDAMGKGMEKVLGSRRIISYVAIRDDRKHSR